MLAAIAYDICFDWRIYEYDVTVGSGTGTAWTLAVKPAIIDPKISPCLAVQAAPIKAKSRAADLVPNATREIFRSSAACRNT